MIIGVLKRMWVFFAMLGINCAVNAKCPLIFCVTQSAVFAMHFFLKFWWSVKGRLIIAYVNKKRAAFCWVESHDVLVHVNHL